MTTETPRLISFFLLAVLLTGLGTIPTDSARADSDVIEEAHAKTVPWSGYWWPHRQGAMLIPLGKYDRLTQAAATEWEKQHHPPGESVPEWFGFCHAWAASAVLENEPAQGHNATWEQRKVQLEVGDQKGLLAASHARDVANTYGDRFGDGDGSEDRGDLAPESLWRLLKLYVKQQGLPLVLDIEAGAEVWNYPIYAYQITRTGERGNGVTTAQLALWMADNEVSPNHVGLKPRYQTYQFQYTQRNGSIVMGSGQWIGASEKDHPDFAWYPYIARPENPEVRYAVVRELLNLPATNPVNPDPGTSGEPAPTTSELPAPDPATSESPDSTESAVEPDNPDRPDPGTEPANPDPDTGNNPNAVPGNSPDSNPPPGTEPSSPEPASSPDSEPTSDHGQPAPAAGVGPDEILMSPLELVALVSRTSSFGLSVNTSPFGMTKFNEGDPLRLSIASEQSGYLYVVHVTPDGQLYQLFPQPGMDNRIEGGDAIHLPDDSWPVGFRAVRPYGNHRIKAFVTSRRVVLSGLQAIFATDGDRPEPGQQRQLRQQQQQPDQEERNPRQQTPDDVEKPEPEQRRQEQAGRNPKPRRQQEQARAQGGRRAGIGFRWHPTQRQQLGEWVQRILKDEADVAQELQEIDVARILGEFAQSSVTFHVGPAH